MSGAVPRITGRAPAPPTGAAALARTVRLLTAVALLGMALLAVALVGHSVAGAREQPPAAGPGPVESATARYTAPAAGPLTRSPAYAQAGRLLEAIPGRPPRTARAGAAGASWPPPPRAPSRNQPAVEGPHWEHAVRRPEPLTAADPPGEAGTGGAGGPATNGRAPEAGAARIVPVRLWSLWTDPESLTYLDLSPSVSIEGFGSSAWPTVHFPSGAALPQRDVDGRLVVPWGQVKLRRGGVRETYDGSRITRDDKVELATQGDPVTYHVDGSRKYANGIVDYPRNAKWARWLPDTSTAITRDGRILTIGPGGEVEGEVLKDGSYLSADGRTRSFVDGTRLIGNEWWFWGGLHLNAQGQLLRPDDTEIDLENGTVYLPRGTRIRSGGFIDFASGDVGLPGGGMAKARVQDALAADRPALNANAAGPRPPTGERTPQDLDAPAVRLLDALDSVAYHRTRLTLAWGEPGQQASDWDVLRNRESELRAEYVAARKLTPFPPALGDLRREELQLQAASLRAEFGQAEAQLNKLFAQRQSPESTWDEFVMQLSQQNLLRNLDYRAAALWARLESTRQEISELGVPDTADKQRQLDLLAGEEQALQKAYDTIRQDMPFSHTLLGSSKEVLRYRVEALNQALDANTARLAELGDPDAPEHRTQRYEIGRERRSMVEEARGIRRYLEMREAPAGSSEGTEEPSEPTPMQIPPAVPSVLPEQQTRLQESPGTPPAPVQQAGAERASLPPEPAVVAPPPASGAAAEVTQAAVPAPPREPTPGPTLLGELVPQGPAGRADPPAQEQAAAGAPAATPDATRVDAAGDPAQARDLGSGTDGSGIPPGDDGGVADAGMMADLSFDLA